MSFSSKSTQGLDRWEFLEFGKKIQNHSGQIQTIKLSQENYSYWLQSVEKKTDKKSLYNVVGTTTVLTMTFLCIDNRQDLPKVAYSTALDIFVAVSFVFVLTTIIQFAAVHFFTKYGTGEKYRTGL